MRFASTSSVTFLAALGLGLGSVPLAHAQGAGAAGARAAPPSPRPAPGLQTVDLEVISVGPGGGLAPLTFSIPLLDEHDEHTCGSAELDHNDRHVEVEVCRERGYAGNVIRVSFDERTRHNGKQTGQRRARATAAIAPGKRVVLGRVTSGGVAVLELAAQVR